MDQPDILKNLKNPEFYGSDVKSVSILQTHISFVALTGKYAYKVKKPVNFGFLDFSTLEKRKYFCEEELKLNRRLCPDIYLEVLPITRYTSFGEDVISFFKGISVFPVSMAVTSTSTGVIILRIKGLSEGSHSYPSAELTSIGIENAAPVKEESVEASILPSISAIKTPSISGSSFTPETSD